MDKYSKGVVLGRGTFGEVIKATHNEVECDGSASGSDMRDHHCLTERPLACPADWQSGGNKEDTDWGEGRGRAVREGWARKGAEQEEGAFHMDATPIIDGHAAAGRQCDCAA